MYLLRGYRDYHWSPRQLFSLFFLSIGLLPPNLRPWNLVMVQTTMNWFRGGHYRQWRWLSSRWLFISFFISIGPLCLHLSHSAGCLGKALT